MQKISMQTAPLALSAFFASLLLGAASPVRMRSPAYMDKRSYTDATFTHTYDYVNGACGAVPVDNERVSSGPGKLVTTTANDLSLQAVAVNSAVSTNLLQEANLRDVLYVAGLARRECLWQAG